MIKYKTYTEEVERPESIICDKCKKEYNFETDWIETQEFHHIHFTGGYGSIFGDMSEIDLNICQHCLFKMIGDLVEESYRDKCPDCGTKLVCSNGGGVKCTKPGCGYWFCY